MMTLEQLQCAAQRIMIELSEDEAPALLHALRQLKPCADLLAQVQEDPAATAHGCASAFPDALRPDCVAPFLGVQTLLQNAAASQENYLIVRRPPAQEEGHL